MFTKLELRDLARGQRVLAGIARKDGNAHSNPSTKALFERQAQAHEELAEKCEELAKSTNP